MVRYQRRQNNNRRLEQNPLFSRDYVGLKTDTGLNLKTNRDAKNRTGTVLESGTISKSKDRGTLRLKRKLLVYKQGNQFYIDHSAAYALKLTNVRAIMLEKSKLVEVGLDFLSKMQQDKDVQIEYKDLDREKENNVSEEDLTETLQGLENEKYGIGVHGIDKGTREERQDKAENISLEGLNIGNNSRTILSTSISLGVNENEQQLSQEIGTYRLGNGSKTNVVIAVPQYVQNQEGKKIFLGFPERNKKIAGQQYEEHCILDRICSKTHKIPSEFILGYVSENTDGSTSFFKNVKHYANLSQQDKETLYDELSKDMDDVSKSINELIANGNVEKLEQMRQSMQKVNLPTYIIDNAKQLIQKYREQEKEKLPIRRTKRKILLEAYRDKEVKLSDMTSAKESLREGTQEQEKQNEGKEI